MTKLKATKTIFLSVAMLAAGLLQTGAVAEPLKRLPRHTVPLSATELRKLYADKTWNWEAGGARFIGKDRKLIAYSEDGGVPTIAEGRWQVNNQGRLCMVAVWVTKEARAKAKSCFRLVRDRGTIYQRREPKGNWYVLKTFMPKPDDEFNKFVSEDTISSNLERIKQGLK